MADNRIYMHIQFDLEEDRVSFDDEDFVNIGRSLLDFIYYDFKKHIEENDKNSLMLHPFIKKMNVTDDCVRQLEVLQDEYKQYFSYLVEEVQTEVIGSQMNKFGCIAGMKLIKEDDKSYVEYVVTDLKECLYLEWFELTRRKLHVKLCKNCHRIFVPKKGNIDYCQRVFSTDGKTCAQVGYAHTFAKSVKSDELLQAYTRAYKAHYARMTKPRKRAANMTKEEFEAWYTQAKAYLNLARQGKIDTDEYLEWLKQ